jgi:hypothetical protein
MPLAHLTQEGSLSVGGVALANAFGAWGIVGDERGNGGLVKLWTDFDVRGEDRILPSVTGVIAYPRRMTATRHDLRLLVTGDVNGQTGATPSDATQGLETNLEYLRANFLAPVATATGTRAATLTMPSGSTRTADIHVLGTTVQTYLLQECASLWIGTVHIDIPEGRFS